MFGLFTRRKKTQSPLDELIFSIYGNPPPLKRANLIEAIALANDLLLSSIDERELRSQAATLNDGPIPYSTHDLALSVAMSFFQRPENITELFEAQLVTRMQMVEWLQNGLVARALVQSFENTLYKLYKANP